ncbi:MAG: DUF342 domain-containing protein [Solirubrobacterales bacterium]
MNSTTGEKIEITIAPNKMQALLTLNLPPDKSVSPEEIFRELEIKRIVYGVNIDRIHRICEMGVPVFQEVIAAGTAPVPGRDAEIEYKHIKPEAAPELVEDGRVNYYELGKIVLVEKGDILATRIPATEGEVGYNIFGDEIPPMPGKNKGFSVGPGVSVEGDNAVAAIEGALNWEGPKVCVANAYTVFGDVDFSIGNIRFSGKVLILGNVREGFKVEADHDIEIRGGVEAAQIISHRGSVIVQAGIIGMGKATVKAANNVEARFIQEATIEAGRNIVINEYIIRSNITAGDSVLIQGYRGKVLGDNTITAQTKIKVNAIQSDRGLDLTVSGIDRIAYYERIKEINGILEERDKEMRGLAVRARLLGGRKDEQSVGELKDIIPRYVRLSDELDSLKDERSTLMNILKTTRGEGMIEVKGQVEMGQSFRIKNDAVHLREPSRNITMYYDHEEKRIIMLNNV